MLHPFDIVMDYLLVEPQETKKISQQLVPPGNIPGQSFSRRSQDQAAILLIFQESIGIETLHHVAHAGL